ncbi:hypothetical protein ES703_89164 [subsurface metagenome]
MDAARLNRGGAMDGRPSEAMDGRARAERSEQAPGAGRKRRRAHGWARRPAREESGAGGLAMDGEENWGGMDADHRYQDPLWRTWHVATRKPLRPRRRRAGLSGHWPRPPPGRRRARRLDADERA